MTDDEPAGEVGALFLAESARSREIAAAPMDDTVRTRGGLNDAGPPPGVEPDHVPQAPTLLEYGRGTSDGSTWCADPPAPVTGP